MKKKYSNPYFKTNGRFKRIAYYTILFITLHWSILAPAQNVLNLQIDVHKLNSKLFGGFFDETSKEIKIRLTPSIDNAESSKITTNIIEAKDSCVSVHEKNTLVKGILQPISTLKTGKAKSQKGDLNETRFFPADIGEGVIGYSAEQPMDNPVDNLFKIDLKQLPSENNKIYLRYDLYGILNQEGVSRSINERSAMGGHIIKENTFWTSQEEELNPAWLQQGENAILFTVPEGANYQYKVRNLRIETEAINVGRVNPILVLQTNDLQYKKDNSIYLRGFVKDALSESLQVYAGETLLHLNNGEFEGLIRLDEQAKNRGAIAIRAVDETGLLGQEILRIDDLKEADKWYPIEQINETLSKFFEANKSNFLYTEEASIAVQDSSLIQSKEISITKLRSVDLPPLDAGMRNVSKNGKGYRFLPDGTTFSNPVKISISYDSILIPRGYEPKDVRTFYFDTQTKHWSPLKIDSVDIVNKKIISYTTHFTDYINGIIQSPESPETSAFLPTMMNDIQAVDPSSGMTLIAPPTASQTGDGRISYPIKIPAGRNGMQPQVALEYSNEGGNGWLGLGWNLSTPAITLDTRWGAPLFNSSKETEIYSLNGQQLMYPDNYLPNRHKGEVPSEYTTILQDRNSFLNNEGNKQFTARKQGGFNIIERIGNSPSNYYWKVTDAQGKISWYGGNTSGLVNDAILRNDSNKIVHWGLVMVEDVFGNNIKFDYFNDVINSPGSNLHQGKYIYPKTIKYTGKDGADGNYHIDFVLQSSIKPDATFDGKLGMRKVEAFLLDQIDIFRNSNKIRNYKLHYDLGQFNKNLLTWVSENDGNNNEFYKHTFDYYNDIENGVLYLPPHTINIDNIDANFGLDIFADELGKSTINTQENIESSYFAGVSAGLDIAFPSQNKQNIITITAPLGENSYKTKGKITLMDIDGDGLDDIIYRVNNGLKYWANKLESQAGQITPINSFENSPHTIHNISDFSKSKGFSKTMFGESFEVNVLPFQASKKRVKSKTETDTYLVDGNGDGLVDVVHDNVVYFNTIDDVTGEPTFFSGSENSENMLITAGDIGPWVDPNPDPEPPVQDEAVFDFDVMRVWVAPRDGEIQIYDALSSSSNILYTIETSNENIGSGAPFRIYHNRFSGVINFVLTSYENGAPLGLVDQNIPVPNPNVIYVNKGQKIFFRVHNEPEDGRETTKSEPRIVYQDAVALEDEYHFTLTDFMPVKQVLSGDGIYSFPGNGFASINFSPIQIAPKDEVVYRIFQLVYDNNSSSPQETEIYRRTCPANVTTTVSPGTNDLPVFINLNSIDCTNTDQRTSFRFEVYSDSYFFRESAGRWGVDLGFDFDDPNIENRTVFAVPHKSFYRATNFSPSYFHLLDNTNWVTPIIPPSGVQHFYARPNITSGIFNADDNGKFKLIIKNNNNAQIMGKSDFVVSNGQVTVGNPIEIFYGNLGSLNNPDDLNFSLGYYAIGDKNSELLNKFLIEVGQNQSVQISYTSTFTNSSTYETSAIEYYDNFHQLGPIYRGWGQFFYNENYDASNIISDDDGKLINEDIIDNPEDNINGGITPPPNSPCDPADPNYVECIRQSMPNFDDYNDDLDAYMEDLEQWMSDYNYTVPEITFLPGTPYIANSRYGYRGLTSNQFVDENYIGTENMASIGGGSGSGNGGGTGPFSGNINETDTEIAYENIDVYTGMHAVNKVHRSSTTSLGAGIGSFLLSESKSGYSNTLQEFIDINGDNYPDVLYPDEVYTTSMTGGHANIGDHHLADPNSYDNNVLGLSLKTSLLNPRLSLGMGIGQQYGLMNNTSFDLGSLSERIGIGFSIDGENLEKSFYLDINGDGLQDRIKENENGFRYQLNKGNILTVNSAPAQTFPFLSGNNSRPTGISLDFGISFSPNQFINAGNIPYVNFNLGFSGSQSSTLFAYNDLNGDGLVDILETANPSGTGTVRFNTGTGFGSAVPISAFGLRNDNRNRGVAVSGDASYYYGFPICCGPFPIVYLKFGANVGGSLGTSLADNRRTFKDLNGDGYPDFIVEDSDGSNNNNLTVHYSAIGRTNMLKTVENPLGGSFTMDYQPQLKSYGNPHSKWALTKVEINDGYDAIVNHGENNYVKYFIYENGKYDRREREFYGYEFVKVKEYSGGVIGLDEPYRTSVFSYYNNNYYLNGLLKESVLYKGNESDLQQEPTNIFSKTENAYTLYPLVEGNMEIDLQSNPYDETYDVGGTEGRGTAVALLSYSKNSVYNLTGIEQYSETEMEYDEKARVINVDYSDINSNNYTSEISYHSESTLIDKNIINVPEEINVKIGSTLMRQRSTEVDVNTGSVTKITAAIDISNNEYADTEITYDSYGNFSTVSYPDNGFGQNMSYTYTYDSGEHKYVTEITDAFGYSSTASYDPEFDNLLETVDMSGYSIIYSYDSYGRITSITAPKEQLNPAANYTIKYAYYTKYEELAGIANINSADFMPVAVTSHFDVQQPNDDIDTYTFIDGLARPVQVKKDIQVPASFGIPGGIGAEMSISGKTKYDEFGRAVKQYHPWHEGKNPDLNYKLNNATNITYYSTTEYDEMDRVVKTIDPAGNISEVEYSMDGTLQKITSTVDQNAQAQLISEAYKDALGRVVKSNNVGPSGDIITLFDYNSIGELLSYTDAENISTSYVYDQLGRKKSMQSPDSGITSYTYAKSGNLLTLQTAEMAINSDFINYQYDFTHLIGIVYPANGSEPNIANVSYLYDGPTDDFPGRLVHQEDATGLQDFEYGSMGELVYSKRTVVGPNIPTRAFETEFKYDSWNRLLEITYPDGEIVNYTYDKGGNLTKMTRDANGTPYNYIKEIKYDYYEQPTYIEYGNSTKMYYTYSADLRRLNNYKLRASNNNYLLNNTYSFDKVGNITSLANAQSFSSPTHLGGVYNHDFEYDVLNRLVDAEGTFTGNQLYHYNNGNDYQASYDLQMNYNDTHGITEKKQNHAVNNTLMIASSYDHSYTYASGSHRLEKIEVPGIDPYEQDYTYDANGNIKTMEDGNSTQDYYWDESNRLRVIDDNDLIMHHYIYDAGGERVLKSSSQPTTVNENGTPINPSSVLFDSYTTYPSPLIVIKGDGEYTKHYFNGSQRVVSRIGDEDADYFDVPDGLEFKELQNAQIADLQRIAQKAGRGTVSFREYKPLEKDSVKIQAKGPTPLLPGYTFYYHPDHLGTGTFITDLAGQPYQFFLNLPFGETMAEQRNTNSGDDYDNRYKFNGKELDEETGLYYYGSRYYNPNTSIWLSVDPLAEKGPQYSPYIYTFNNPINLTDPDGRWPDPPTWTKFKNIWGSLSKNSTVYVFQEIPQRNSRGTIILLPQSRRMYNKILLNQGTKAGSPMIYLTESISSTSYGRPGFTYGKHEGKTTSHEIGFVRNSNELKNSDLSGYAQNIIETGSIVDIQGRTNLSEDAPIGTSTINGETSSNWTVNDLVQARAETIYNNLRELGVSEDQLNIVPAQYNSDSSTILSINQKPELTGIKPEQIQE